MNRAFAVKLIILLWSWIRTAILLFPIMYLVVSVKQGKLKYGYDFFEVDYRWALMIAFGIAMALVVWTAMEFSGLGFTDLRQYLKSKQKHYFAFKKGVEDEQIAAALSGFAGSKRRWKFQEANGSWSLEKRNPYFIRDSMRIERVDGGLSIESKPKGLTWFVDAGRNFKHILALGDYLRDRAL